MPPHIHKASIKIVLLTPKAEMAKKVEIKETEVLSDNFFPLHKVKFELEKRNGELEELTREVYLSANGATVLLYNRENKTVVLTKQFRLPSYLNNNPTGMMIETCAGIVEDGENPAKGVIREIEEETGYKIENVKKVFELYMTPGSVAEMLHFFCSRV